MMLLTVEEIIALQEKLIAKTGGASGLRDRGLLESAVLQVSAAYQDVEFYPSVEEKAARFAYGLIQNHAFLDGNKRIGVLALLMTLRLNAYSISYTQAELIALGLSAAAGELSCETIAAWIRAHRIPNQ